MVNLKVSLHFINEILNIQSLPTERRQYRYTITVQIHGTIHLNAEHKQMANSRVSHTSFSHILLLILHITHFYFGVHESQGKTTKYCIYLNWLKHCSRSIWLYFFIAAQPHAILIDLGNLAIWPATKEIQPSYCT